MFKDLKYNNKFVLKSLFIGSLAAIILFGSFLLFNLYMQKRVFAYSGEWWNDSWNNRIEISITNTGSSELIDFPAYLDISKELEMQENYDDLKFINGSCGSNGSIELDYEIEYSSSLKADVWVKIPTLSTGITDICMYYGNTEAVSGENKIGVWNNNYKGAWHMTEVDANDSTFNNNNGTQYNGVTETNGIVDGADYFADGDSVDGDYISLENDSSLQITENLTVEAWVKIAGSSGEYLGIVGKLTQIGFGTYSGYALVRYFDNTFRLWIGDGLGAMGDVSSDSTYTDSNWHYVVGVINNGTNYLYVDGVQQSDTDNLILADSENQPYIGRQYSGTSNRCWQGDIDEVRISNINRSADWVKQSYEMVANQGTYVDFGEREFFSSGSSGSENIESINLGGWSYDDFFGWTSESCNNLYGESYDDYCRIEIDSILDISFDGDNIDIDNNFVEDTANNFDGALFNFVKTDIRNGGKGKSSGIVKRDSNFDNSLYFNGLNSYINFGSHNELSFDSGDFTVSLWFKIDPSSSGSRFLFSNGNEIDERYHCWIDASDYLFCTINNHDLDSGSAINTEKWNNVSIVSEGGLFSMYLNGFSEGDINIGPVFPPGSEDLILGANGNHADNFKGELDEFRLFDEALNSDQVLHNTKYNSDYLLNIEDGSGIINGWVWSNGIGWICFGDTCLGTDPDGNAPDAKLHWFAESGNIYPHMITGWANAVAFNDSVQYPDAGWMKLQNDDIMAANYDDYDSCVSCSFRDEENGLVLYLKMDEDDGFIATDSSGFSNYADLIDFEDPEWLNEGKVNNCLVFDGEDDSLEIDVSSNEELNLGLGDFSIEAWVKNEKEHESEDHLSIEAWVKNEKEHESEDHLSIISGKANKQWELYFDPVGSSFVPVGPRLVFEIFGKTVDGPIADIASWSHVVVIGNRNGNLEMYINNLRYVGEDISSSSGLVIDNLEFFIGKDGNGSFWDDKIDIIRIYTRALSVDEVSYNYDFPEKRFCSACLSQTLDTVEINNICYECERCELASGVTDCEACSSCRQYGLVFDSNAANIKGYAWGGNTIGDDFVGLGWFQFSPNSGAGLYRSYVSSKYGDIYSRANIGSDYTVVAPEGYKNSSYMIQANGHIINWFSEKYDSVHSPFWHMSSDSGDPVNYEYPKLENDYGNVLGNLDYNGLINGTYGGVIKKIPNEDLVNHNVCLGDNIYYAEARDVVLEGMAYTFENENCAKAAGTIIIDGDLTINTDIQYNTDAFSGSSDNLASVAWIIKGDLKISPDVEKLAGTFIVLGKDGVSCGSDLENPVEGCGAIFTCDGDASFCGNPLEVSGQFLAKNLRFGRTYRTLGSSEREAAESIVYDGRNVINPPPGLGDILKSLPTWNQIAPY